MAFFRGFGRSERDPERGERLADAGARREEKREEDSLERIEAGGIPLTAERRLQALGAGGGLFASALSVNEFSLLHATGPRPLAQVLGASVIRVAPAYLPMTGRPAAGGTVHSPMSYGSGAQAWLAPSTPVRYGSFACEIPVLTHAWTQARRRAIERMTEEALQVGADAIVGVRLQRGEHDLGKRTIDYLISGTAIRTPGSPLVDWPLLSDLSVQDYWRLAEAGYASVGLLASTAVVFATAGPLTRRRRWRRMAQPQELAELSTGFRMARAAVRQRLLSQLDSARGEGMVGVRLSHSIHRESLPFQRAVAVNPGWIRRRLGISAPQADDAERKGWLITMHGAGTAIRRRERVPQYPPETIMGLGRG